MAHQATGRATAGGGPAKAGGRVGTTSFRRPDQLAPLLHQLLDGDLVRPTEWGSFELRDDVQDRLRELTATGPRPDPDVFVGRPCQRCSTVAVTRLVDGTRLCEPCREELAADRGDDAAAFVPAGRRRLHWPRRHRTAS